MTTAALIALALAATPVEEPPSRWTLLATAGGGWRGEGAGAQGQAGLRYDLSERFAVEAVLGEGLYDWPGQSIGRIGLTGRLEWPSDVARPSVLLGFTHAHEELLEDLQLSSLAGFSDTMRHRTGVEAGGGFTFPLAGQYPVGVLLQARGGWYVDGRPGALHGAFDLGFTLDL